MNNISIEDKIALRKKCNFLLNEVVALHSSLHPDQRYIQSLWALDIIDASYIPGISKGEAKDRFYEESYDTVVRILPQIGKLLESKSSLRHLIAGVLENLNFETEGKLLNNALLNKSLNSGIPDNIKKEFESKYNKKVFFEYEGNCKTGKLIGLSFINGLEYLIDTKDKKIYVPCNNSLTLL